MSFSGKDLFEFVIKLNDEKGDFSHSQGVYRTIISRAYYSAFLCGRSDAGIPEGESSNVHQQVGNHLKSNHPAIISNGFYSLMRLRKKADYKLSKSCSSREVSESLRQADKILNHLGCC